MKITITTTAEVDVKFLRASCGRCYWEDATVDGVEDIDGTLIPCRIGDNWCPLIDLETGVILNWTQGKTADIHYKVCDEGVYELLTAGMHCVKKIEGYVPDIMCPDENGYGDYVIMKVDASGKIANWHGYRLEAFENSED